VELLKVGLDSLDKRLHYLLNKFYLGSRMQNSPLCMKITITTAFNY